MPLPLDNDISSDQSSESGEIKKNKGGPGPSQDLAPNVLMPELASLLSDCGDGGGGGDGGGVACTLSFGREEGKDGWLSFVVSGAGGEEIASLTLAAAT